MNRWLAYSSILLLLGLSWACRKDPIISDPSDQLEFSEDTVIFDTVFTTIGSTTEWLIVHNPHNKSIVISDIMIAGGKSSNFRMNVDGVPGDAKDIEIKANDSIFVFVEVTVDPNSVTTPMIITDSLLFITNGNIQDIDLVAWGQDAYFYPSTLFSSSQTLPSDKPHVFYGYSFVDTATVLTIKEGTQLHFHQYSGLAVLKGASLRVNGKKDNEVVFQGDRLEFAWSEEPGQWGHPFIGGIWLSPLSIDNIINYAIIKNGNIGVEVDTFANANHTLIIKNTVVKNMSGAGLLAKGSDVVATNCVFANCGQYVTALVYGGRNYEFRHCTFVNYWKYGTRKNPSLLLNNYYETANEVIITRPLENAYFGNCIIMGPLVEEVELDENTSANFSYLFENCILQTELDATGTEFINITKNPPTVIVESETHNGVFNDVAMLDFHLFSLSAALDKGTTAVMDTLFTDLDGVTRDANPDLGAYEFE